MSTRCNSSNTRLPSKEGFQQLLNVLDSFKGNYNERCVATVDICQRMEDIYGHIYKIDEMECYLRELTKNAGLKHSGEIRKGTPDRYLDTVNSPKKTKSVTKPTFMPIAADSNGNFISSIWAPPLTLSN